MSIIASSSFTSEIIQTLLHQLLGYWHLIGIVFIIILLKGIFSSPSVKGWWGELQVTSFGLKRLDPAIYKVFNDIYLPRPDGKGTTQIDHLVISRFGLFVIETKNYGGWIFGSENQRQWTQQIYKRNTASKTHFNKTSFTLTLSQSF
ncbi:nuclease-related domain-containing protein [Rubritalea squalenifaciens]|uniref:nuclease-related domain-containing protein n=1 Tax=Rubritalea squalenifaciens TaxID=407226 RepID=UPI0011608C70|nr:nuclease-related domain-containing protein [Rubritalea squalenifaciens]